MGYEGTFSKMSKNEYKELKRKLVDIGIYPSLDGFDYILSAVTRMRGEGKLRFIELYKKIAVTHDTTESRVERAIRHAIFTAWRKDGLDEKYKVSEFLSLLAEDLL